MANEKDFREEEARIRLMGGNPKEIDLVVFRRKVLEMSEYDKAFFKGEPSSLVAMLLSDKDFHLRDYFLPVMSVLPLSLIDPYALDLEGKDFSHGFDVLVASLVESCFEKLGGKGVVEIGEGFLCVWWLPPLVGAMSSIRDLSEVAWCSYMLQAGLLRNPVRLIANRVHSGGSMGLANLFALAGKHGFNRYSSGVGAGCLSCCAPFLSSGWIAKSLCEMHAGELRKARASLEKTIELFPDDVSARRLLIVCLSKLAPKEASRACSAFIGWFNRHAVVPSLHDKVAIGMAFFSAGENNLATLEFSMVDELHGTILMSVDQWVGWGFGLGDEELLAALEDPSKFKGF